MKGSSPPNMFAAATWPWRSATTQCSTRRLSPVWGSGQRAMSPAAKMSGIASLQARIDQNAAIQHQTSRLRELKARLDADAHNHNVRVDPLSPLQDDLLVFNPSDPRTEVKAHPLSGVTLWSRLVPPQRGSAWAPVAKPPRRDAPPHLPGWLMARVLGYRLQVAAFGDLDRASCVACARPRTKP